MSHQDVLVAWLNDAHGMENALVQILEHQVKDAKDYPQVQAKLQEHLEMTRRHAEMVKECVERLGGSTSSLKSGMASLFGQMQALSTGAAKDEMVKNALADYAAENFEVASYTALVSAAQSSGNSETASVCQQILQEDRGMAQWIEQNLPMLVQETMSQMVKSGVCAACRARPHPDVAVMSRALSAGILWTGSALTERCSYYAESSRTVCHYSFSQRGWSRETGRRLRCRATFGPIVVRIALDTVAEGLRPASRWKGDRLPEEKRRERLGYKCGTVLARESGVNASATGLARYGPCLALRAEGGDRETETDQ